MTDLPTWWEGRSADLTQADAFVTPSEGILSSLSFTALARQVHRWGQTPQDSAFMMGDPGGNDSALVGEASHLLSPRAAASHTSLAGDHVGRQALSKRVFIVHGHDELAKVNVARLLERLGLEAVILHEQANQGQTVIEKIEKYSDVGFAVVLLTPDDVGGARGQPQQARVRQNVLLELGYFIGRLSRSRVCALRAGEVEIPSDYLGVVWTAMDAAGAWKYSLAKELSAAGYVVDLHRVA